MKTDLTFWKDGEKNREFALYYPCSCGCDFRDGKHKGWAGYFSASDKNGNGFSLWIKNFRQIKKRQPNLIGYTNKSERKPKSSRVNKQKRGTK